jgi:ankyrin repeat protein
MPQIVRALDKYAARQQKALVSVAFRGDLGTVQQLLAEGAVPDDGDYDGRTALQVRPDAGKVPPAQTSELWNTSGLLAPVACMWICCAVLHCDSGTC